MFKTIFVVSCLLVIALATPVPENPKADSVPESKKTDKRHAVFYETAPIVSYQPYTSYVNPAPVYHQVRTVQQLNQIHPSPYYSSGYYPSPLTYSYSGYPSSSFYY